MSEITIQRWQESMLYMPEEKFFDIMRLYLGEIKTPYNKQRLVSELATFVKNPQNYKRILSYIDIIDAKILSAINFIQNPTLEMICDFFSEEFSLSEIYSEISNLQERLLIFFENYDFQNTKKQILRINPLFSEELKKFIKIENILFKSECEVQNINDSFSISPDFLAAIFSYIKIQGCSCKNDGSIKKSDFLRLEKIFQRGFDCVEKVIFSFINLGILFEGKKNLEINENRLKKFCELEEIYQYAFLCAASVTRLGRERLKFEAQKLIDCLESLENLKDNEGFSFCEIKRLGFLIMTKQENSQSESKNRFSKMIESARNENSQTENLLSKNDLFEEILKTAINFGLIKKLGFDKNSNEIFKAGEVYENLKNHDENSKTEKKGSLNVDSTFTVTLLPKLILKNLIPLTSFLLVKNFSTVTEFEITKKSVSVAFNEGFDSDSILKILSEYTSYDFPQNLKISVEDWFKSYASAVIYFGYVLKVSENNIGYVENNPVLKNAIREKLSEGVYLLKFLPDFDIEKFIKESGLEILGKIKSPENSTEAAPFPVLHKNSGISKITKNTSDEKIKFNIKESEEFLNLLKKSLENLQIEEQRREILLRRISDRLIISESQIQNPAIKLEILEADGMDISGKIHLIQKAIEKNEKIEITIPQNQGYKTFVVSPQFLSCENEISILKFQIEGETETKFAPVSKFTHVKRLRF